MLSDWRSSRIAGAVRNSTECPASTAAWHMFLAIRVFPKPFLPTNTAGGVTQPGIDKTGALPVHPPQPSVPYEQLLVPAPRMGAAGSQSQTSGMPSGNAPAVGADGQPVQAPAPASAPPAASPVKQ